MPIRNIESKDNARLKELRKALSAPGRGVGALVGIEGPNLIEEALRASLLVKSIFLVQGPDQVSERLFEALKLPPETEVLRLPKKLLDQALATETPQSIAALVQPPNWSWSHVLNQNQKKTLVIVLAGIQDPGNLGTILRSAEAFGATGVISLPGTVNAWNPKAVRASAGSVFRMPILAASVDECFAQLKKAGVKVLATTARSTDPSDLTELDGPIALIIGNEGNGIPAALAVRADSTIAIPCPGPVESLNAAVAASVLLYEASRQRVAASSAASKNLGARR
jgi:RNA methyltransferase, TrmH family